MAIREVSAGSFRWINITGATADDTPEVSYLREHFPYFQALDIKDCVSNGQRPKLEIHEKYAFLVLLFPVFNRKTREIEPTEIDFFIQKDLIITIHDERLHSVQHLFTEVKALNAHPQAHLDNPLLLTAELTNRQLNASLPMLDHISMDLHAIERLIFRGSEKSMVKEILVTRRNITDFRKIMQAHKNVVKKMEVANRVLQLTEPETANALLNNAVERTKEIWDHLEAFKESVEALQQTNESLISFRLNDIMKTYTTISVIIFTLTLATTIIAARLARTPLVDTDNGFYGLLGLLAIITGLSVYIFKRKRWL
ncbi:MAG: CorA family divalent cation transporter [Patescibacteria group bacterium]|jgi:magnesium transporter